MAELVYRSLSDRDRVLSAGDSLALSGPIDVSPDARVATRNWADESILAIWCDEACTQIPAGARFRVAGSTLIQHHGSSALDLELPMLVLVADGTPMGDDAVTRAALMVRLALASGEAGADGRDYAAALPR